MGLGPRRGFVRSGASLLGIGYAVGIAAALNGFTRSQYNGEGGYEGCHDPAGAVSLVPILGPLIAAIMVSNCDVPYYRFGEIDEYVPADSAGQWVFGVIATAFEVIGLGLLIGGLLHTKPLIDYEDVTLRVGDVQVAVLPWASLASAGIGVTVTR
jgi:hypothetical protein